MFKFYLFDLLKILILQDKMDENKSVDLSKLDELLECPLCLETCEDPKTLPCHHWFCAPCLDRVVRNLPPEGWFSCPNCRTDVQIPVGGVQNFPAAFIINRLSEFIGKQKKSGVVQCSTHGQDCEMFCETCTQLICVKCCTQEHKGHAKKHVEEIAEEYKTKLTHTQNSVLEKKRECKRQLDLLKKAKQDCETEAMTKKDAIKAHGDRIIQKVHLAVVQMQQKIVVESAITVNNIEEAESVLNAELLQLEDTSRILETSLSEENAASMIDTSISDDEKHRSLLEEESGCGRFDISKMTVLLQLPNIDKIPDETLLGPLHFAYTNYSLQAESGATSQEGTGLDKVK
jgi:hypothetical protein